MMSNQTSIHIFKSAISQPEDIATIKSVLDAHPRIVQWSVDMEDHDHALRVVSSDLSWEDVRHLMKTLGYNCSELI